MPVIVPGTNTTPINAGSVTSATLQNAQTGNANGTDYDITGMATVQLLVNPTSWTGTVTFWASIDGTTFVKIRGNQQDTTTIADNVANPGSTASIWTFQTAGLTKIRAVTTNAGGTSVTVTGAASPFPNSVPLGVTLSSAVLAAGSALIGGVNIVDSAGTNKAGVDASHNVQISDGGTATVVITASSAGAVKAAPGRLCRVLTTSAATSAVNIYDNTNAASGTIIATIPAATAVGTVYSPQMPAAVGIYVGGGAGTPGLTVSYS